MFLHQREEKVKDADVIYFLPLNPCCFFCDAAPDGKEVETQPIGGAEAEAEHSPYAPLGPSCEPNCGCVCHIQWPGMKLIWVPVDDDGGEEEGEAGGEDETDEEQRVEDGEDEEVGIGEEGDSEAGDEGDRTSVVDESEVKQNKNKFHQNLDVLIAEGHRRRSDPGPHSVLALAVTRSHSPPVPPKQSQSAQIHHPPAQNEEEENIYEDTLFVVEPKKAAPVCKELDIPLIKVRKPARRSKLSYSTSDPTSEFQAGAEPTPSPDEVPPAIPPRMPVPQDSRSLTPVHRAGVPLPQPTVEEWRNLRPSSPNSSTGSGLSPQRAITPPPASPHRPPPPPPKADPRRLSSASLQSITSRKGLQ